MFYYGNSIYLNKLIICKQQFCLNLPNYNSFVYNIISIIYLCYSIIQVYLQNYNM